MLAPGFLSYAKLSEARRLSEIEADLTQRLGATRPGSSTQVVAASGTVMCWWQTGRVFLMVSDMNYIFFSPVDASGLDGPSIRACVYPHGTTIAALARAMETTVRHYRDGQPMPGLYREGKQADTRSPRPELRLIRAPEDAESAAAAWMRWMGYDDAEVTGPGSDGGIDVTSLRGVAQVKTETLPVGRPALQRLHGVAVAGGKEGLFFSLSGYTSQAVEWADFAGMPLFRFNLQGEPEPANAEGQQRLS